MKKHTPILMLLMVPFLILLVIATPHLEAGRGGAVAGGVLGGLALGSIIGSAAASRNAYASNEDYINALEEENADLRAELRSMRRRGYTRTYAR